MRYQAELANRLGNLVNRSLKMLKSYRAGKVPARSETLAAEATRAIAAVKSAYVAFELQGALVAAWELVNRANKFVEETAPFKLAKDPSQAAKLDDVLYSLVETCSRILAVLLWPVIPETAGKIFAQLGLAGAPDQLASVQWGGMATGSEVGKPRPALPAARALGEGWKRTRNLLRGERWTRIGRVAGRGGYSQWGRRASWEAALARAPCPPTMNPAG